MQGSMLHQVPTGDAKKQYVALTLAACASCWPPKMALLEVALTSMDAALTPPALSTQHSALTSCDSFYTSLMSVSFS